MKMPIVLTAAVLFVVLSVADAREWTDRRGNKMEAEFVNLNGGLVILAVKGRSRAYPFNEFAKVDQQFVRRQMEAKGQGHRVPEPSKSGSMSSSAYVPPCPPIIIPYRRPQTPIAEAMRRNPFFIPPTVWAQNIRQGQMPAGYRRPRPVTSFKACTHCGRVVHSNARPGQSCPFCGAYWAGVR